MDEEGGESATEEEEVDEDETHEEVVCRTGVDEESEGEPEKNVDEVADKALKKGESALVERLSVFIYDSEEGGKIKGVPPTLCVGQKGLSSSSDSSSSNGESGGGGGGIRTRGGSLISWDGSSPAARAL